MPRPLRPIAEGLIYHVINRGNGRQRVFFGEGDYGAFLKAVGDLKKRKPFELHGYVHQSPSETESASVRRSAETGLPFGEPSWVKQLAKRLNLDLTIRPRGRPRKDRSEGNVQNIVLTPFSIFRLTPFSVSRNIGHAVCIDTWVYGHGWLTRLDVQSGQYWQANENRETRAGWLESCH